MTNFTNEFLRHTITNRFDTNWLNPKVRSLTLSFSKKILWTNLELIKILYYQKNLQNLSTNTLSMKIFLGNTNSNLLIDAICEFIID